MAVYSIRSIINIVNISNNQILDNNYPIPYDEFCFNGNIIKLPQDKNLYSSPSIVQDLHYFFSEGDMMSHCIVIMIFIKI